MRNSATARASALKSANANANAPTGSMSLVGSLSLVIVFWWAATGVTLAMHRNPALSALSILAASALGAIGAMLVTISRNDVSVRGARLAFLGSSLIWWGCCTVFYAGIGVQFVPVTVTDTRTLALAWQAIQSTLRPDLLGVAALIAVAVSVRHSKNRLALWTLLTYWGTLQTAKINVFMGVRNSGVDWLPDHLAQLSQFFGPPRNSWLLPISIALLTVGVAIAAFRAHASRDVFQRHMYSMLTLLLALALIEHTFLGVNFSLPLWDVFRI